MAQDIHHLGAKHCFACVQWDGRRSFDQTAKTIRADIGSDGRCLVKHATVKGSHACNSFYPLR